MQKIKKHRALPPLPSEKLLHCYSGWRFVDTRPIVRPRLRTHFAVILNSTTTNDKRRSYPDTLISNSMVSFADSLFKFLLLPPSRFFKSRIYLILRLSIGLWHREVIESSASKAASVAAEQTALLVFPARNSI